MEPPQATPPPQARELPESEKYLSAIGELNRRRTRWGATRVQRVAAERQLNADKLALSWCLQAAVNRTRTTNPGPRLGVERTYLRCVQGHRATVKGVPCGEGDVALAREALLAAAWGGVERRREVEALLGGRLLERGLREEGVYEDDVVLEGDEGGLRGLCARAVAELVDGGDGGVAEELVAFAERVGRGDVAVDENLLRCVKYRVEGLRWVCGRDDRGGVGAVVDGVNLECGGELDGAVRECLEACFRDEDALAEGVAVFRAVLPPGFLEAVRRREIARLVGLMKDGDAALAGGLIERFGSCGRVLRAGEPALGRAVMKRVHGFDAGLHAVLAGAVADVWLVARVYADRFRGLDAMRAAGFAEFLHGGRGSVELPMDERLRCYRAVHRESFGEVRHRFERSWTLFRAVCECTTVPDCVGMTASLLQRGVDEDLWGACVGLGIDSDQLLALKLLMERE